jgi:hypothetical protein
VKYIKIDFKTFLTENKPIIDKITEENKRTPDPDYMNDDIWEEYTLSDQNRRKL